MRGDPTTDDRDDRCVRTRGRSRRVGRKGPTPGVCRGRRSRDGPARSPSAHGAAGLVRSRPRTRPGVPSNDRAEPGWPAPLGRMAPGQSAGPNSGLGSGPPWPRRPASPARSGRCSRRRLASVRPTRARPSTRSRRTSAATIAMRADVSTHVQPIDRPVRSSPRSARGVTPAIARNSAMRCAWS